TSLTAKGDILALGIKDGVVLMTPKDHKFLGRWRQVSESSRIHSFPVSCIDIHGVRDASHVLLASGSIDRSVVIQETKLRKPFPLDSSIIGLVVSLLVILLALLVYQNL